MNYLHYWMNLGGLLHNFWKWQHTKICKKFFVKPINFFRPKFEKWQNIVFVSTKCWVNFSSMHLGVEDDFIQKTFHGLDFSIFLGTHLVNKFLSYLPVKQIYRKSTVWICAKWAVGIFPISYVFNVGQCTKNYYYQEYIKTN